MVTVAREPTVKLLIPQGMAETENSVTKDPLNELRAELERLRVEFEKYFMGLERRMPSVARDKLAQKIRRFDAGQDSVLRFRHRNLVQRLIVLEQYWNRIMRAMEAGTYSRDVARANFREQRRLDDDPRQTPASGERNREAKKKAAVIGAEAEAFLAQLGQNQNKNIQKSPPKLQMRGRSKRADRDSQD